MGQPELLGEKYVYGKDDCPLRFKIFLKESCPACTLYVFIEETVLAIFEFELCQKSTGWFFFGRKVFPPDEPSREIEEWLSDKKEIAQAIFLEKITQSCWEIVWQLSGGEAASKRELRRIFIKNLPSF